MIFIFFICLNLIIVLKFDLIKNSIKIYDHPDSKRKFHKKPTFIGGGIIIFVNYILIILYLLLTKNTQSLLNLDNNQSYITWILGPILIFILGIYDDKKI